MKRFCFLTLSLFLCTKAVAVPPIETKKIIPVFKRLASANFCESDEACEEGRAAALAHTRTYFSRVKAKKTIKATHMVMILKAGELQAQTACRTHYATKGGLGRCHHGAQAAVFFIATDLGLIERPPVVQPPLSSQALIAPQIVRGPAYDGNEYTTCLTTCEAQTPSPPAGCPAHCRDTFDLKAFLKSLPQLK